MNIRPIQWRDFSVIRSYRHRCVFFDSTMALTRGPTLDLSRTLFSSIAPTQGVFTYLAKADSNTGAPVLGQVTFPSGASSARLTCLAPENALERDGIEAVLDFMITDLGKHGAFHVLAEADECEGSCDALHGMGFAIYGRQRIWQLAGSPAKPALATPWRSCTDQDTINIRSLYNNLAPGLVQQVEPAPSPRNHGLVFYHGQDLLAYVDLKIGPKGIWVQPFIHPDVEDVSARLAYLLQNLPDRDDRPVYICVRSYQAWLESPVEELGAQPGPRQAVMVKRLAISRRVVQPATLPVLEGKQAEPTVPIAPIKRIWFLKK